MRRFAHHGLAGRWGASVLLAVGSFGAASAGIDIPRVEGEIHVDGVLDEPMWRAAARVPIPFEVFPADNAPAPVETECLLAYDEHRLYVAFRARDPRPEEVRAFFSDRDLAVREDLVGLVIDPFGDQRRGFLFLVNPLGVQLDAAIDELSRAGGFRRLIGAPGEDYNWDALWESTGRLTPDGFTVELVLPLSSLRFPRRDGPQSWGFIAYRLRPRSRRHRMASVPLDRDRSCLLCQAGSLDGIAGIEQGRDFELDPTLTVSGVDDSGGGGTTSGRAGLTAHWGVTPDISFEAALDPDFSQVEADVAQIETNRRFALFFPENRPFFLEAQDFFRTPLFAVNTRSVVEPEWGLKLTGKLRRDAFGLFIARDRGTTLVFPGNESSSSADRDAANVATVLRYRRDIGGTSTLGLLLTDRSGDGYANRVLGADGVIRLGAVDRLQFQALRSQTRYPEDVLLADENADGTPDNDQPAGRFAGSALRLRYEREARHWNAEAVYERLDAGFRADLGFIPRVDVRRLEARLERVHWGAEGAFLTQASGGFFVERLEDGAGELTEEELGLSMRLRGPWQSVLFLRALRARERFEGDLFGRDRVRLFYNIRPSATFTHSLRVEAGEGIDFANARRGHELSIEPEFTQNVGRHLFVSARHQFQTFRVRGERLFTVNLSQARIVYQFTPRAFLRLISQYRLVERNPALFDCTTDPLDPCTIEPRERELLNQLLFSYKFNARTVIFAGYDDNRDAAGPGPLSRSRSRIFLKLGYAWLPGPRSEVRRFTVRTAPPPHPGADRDRRRSRAR